MSKARRNSVSATALSPKVSPNSEQKNPNTITRTPTTILSSPLFKSVLLHDWWLVRAPHGKGLAVGGVASLERVGVRIFCSAAISHRHDATTLDTMDGIKITISGFINRSRTHQNGFPSEVCNRFLLGFPYNWEEYAVGCSGEDSTDRGVSTRVSTSDDSSLGFRRDGTFPFSLEDLPVTRIGDLLMSTFGDREHRLITNSIYNDILGKSKGNSPMQNVKSGLNDTPFCQKEIEVDRNSKNDNSGFNSRDMTGVENQKSICHSEISMNVLTSTRGVSTRSMTRLKNSRLEQEDRLSPDTHTKRNYSDQATSSNAARNIIEVSVPRRATKVSRPTKLFGEDKCVSGISDASVRRSSRRLMNMKK
ncbi:hypothetical protein F2P56_027057 [Juglans regia]|uniref:Uncharacterized protein LOC108985203 n=2 Tax=Juglans regia TaxID=51240 RepID=A0A2I4E0M5_JUGRE|nr:uncharacterized protein LOC108985203 [Juglans regia]KAF5452016.1 hypothetical protein F2P56_027057 [Juglans regia]